MRVQCRYCYKVWDDEKNDNRRIFTCRRCKLRGLQDLGVQECLSGEELERFWKWLGEGGPSGDEGFKLSSSHTDE